MTTQDVGSLQPLPDRFWAKVDRSGATSCWLWAGTTSAKGYGKFWWGGRMRPAHRLAYEATTGPIPATLTIDHLCREPSCVNPFHLEPVTMRENILRGNSQSAIHARQTCCVHGHPFNERNTYVDAAGRRHCRECHVAMKRQRRRRRYFQRDAAAGLLRGAKLLRGGASDG